MPRTRVGSVAHAGCAGHPLTPARSRGGAATYIWTQFAAKPSRAVSSITNKKRQYKIGSSREEGGASGVVVPGEAVEAIGVMRHWGDAPLGWLGDWEVAEGPRRRAVEGW